MSISKVNKSYCQKVIPLVYDDSLSYYESLCKLTDKINDIIVYLEQYKEDYKSYTYEQIAKLDEKIQAEILLVKNDYNVKIDNLKQYVDIQDNELRYLISGVEIRINNQLSYIYNAMVNNNIYIMNYINEQINIIKDMIENIIPFTVIDPTTGQESTIQETINNIYSVLRYGGITAQEFDLALFTAQEFDNLLISAIEFDTQGKDILHKNPLDYMFSPFTGEYVPTTTVILELYGLHRQNAATAEGFDALEFDATTLDGKMQNSSASNFDINGVL